MTVERSDANLEESKTLKVTLPTKLHLRLHSLKILSGQTISDTVEAAVERFLDEEVEGQALLLPEGLDEA